jgi:hypothetical protein
MNRARLFKLINLWPPYLGAGIRLREVAPDFTSLEVEMKLRFWNRNYVGTHFGGSLYAMTDPFLMLMMMENLGKDYIVWDKAASIRFKKPGKGRVRARFELPRGRISEIRAEADRLPKTEPEFQVQVLNDADEVVAEVHKTLYVRRKDRSAHPS